MRNAKKRSEFQYLFPGAVLAAMILAATLGIRASANPASGETGAKEQIASEIRRLQQSPVAQTADAAPEAEALRGAQSALDSGLVLASLYQLQSPFANLAMEQYRNSTTEIKEAEAFEKEWQRVGKELTAEEASLQEKKLRELPAAVRALVDSRRMQSRTYFESGHLYARETGVPNGLAYNGLAKGLMEFAVWAAGLKFPGHANSSVPSARSGINELEKEVLQAYNRPGAAEDQLRFNQINSTLKFSGELDRAGKNAAALHQMLSASLLFGGLEAADANPNDASEMRKQSLAIEKRLAGNSSDSSIGEMYWEIAQSELTASASSKTLATGSKRAAIILNDVLPRYFRSMEGGVTAAAPAPAGAPVMITLVRWPYT